MNCTCYGFRSAFADIPARPPAFPFDLDAMPSVLIPPQGVIVYQPTIGWVHFKPMTTEENPT